MKILFLKTLYIINAVVAPYSDEKKRCMCYLWILALYESMMLLAFGKKKNVYLANMSKWMHGRISGELVLG